MDGRLIADKFGLLCESLTQALYWREKEKGRRVNEKETELTMIVLDKEKYNNGCE